MKKENLKTAVWFLIVIVVVAGLVFITVRNKIKNASNPSSPVGTEQNKIMENTQPESGVQVTIVKEGTGREVKAGDTVAVNYTGNLSDGTVFDSNTDSKFGHVEPFAFSVGAGQVIKGWDQGLIGMKVGEIRTLVISPDFGYGATGAGGVIPPNATLTFQVELLGIK